MKSRNVILAVLIGGIVGTAMAMMLRPRVGWILMGMLSGMSLAYLVYDLREVFAKVPVAWKKTKRQVPLWLTEADLKVRNWKPSAFFKLDFLVISLVYLCISITIVWFDFEEYSLQPLSIQIFVSIL